MSGEVRITVRDSSGAAVADVAVVGGLARVEPPEAVGHPLVRAVVEQLETTAARPRPRPSCGP